MAGQDANARAIPPVYTCQRLIDLFNGHLSENAYDYSKSGHGPVLKGNASPVDAASGVSVLQAMHAMGLSPDRQTFHSVLELCAAAAAARAAAKRRSRGKPIDQLDEDDTLITDIATEVVETRMVAEGITPDEQTIALQLRLCANCSPPALQTAVALLEPESLERCGAAYFLLFGRFFATFSPKPGAF